MANAHASVAQNLDLAALFFLKGGYSSTHFALAKRMGGLV